MSLKLRVLGNKPIFNIVSRLKDLFELGSDRVSIEVLLFGLKGLVLWFASVHLFCLYVWLNVAIRGDEAGVVVRPRCLNSWNVS